MVVWHFLDISQSILLRTSRSKNLSYTELGQCVKEVLVSTFDHYDFCSKWIFNGNQWRDYGKVLTHKMTYNKRNQ